jgi:diguanylate cyclase (GGDEF)-like protein
MILQPATVLLIVFIAAVANLLVLLVVSARARSGRANRVAAVEGFISSSYGKDGSDLDQVPTSPDAGLPASYGSPSSGRNPWSDDDWETPGPAAEGVAVAGTAGGLAVDPLAEPFEYPAPNPLEQRSVSLDKAEADAWAEATAEIDGDADDVEAASAEPAETDQIDDVSGAVMDVAEMPRATDGDAVEAEGDDMDDETGSTMDAQAGDGTADAPVADSGATDIEPTEIDATEIDATDEAGEVAATAPLATSRGRDSLTGMLDAVAFEEVMAQEEAREQRYGHPATVIVFELDGLQKLVDRLGPDTGDRIETAVGDTIKRLARRADHVARLERGRYAVLLPETDEVAAINYVERIRRACELWLESGAIAMRLAIGWASTSGDSGLSGAVRIATDRMRQELRRNARMAGEITPGIETLDAGSTGTESHDGDDASEVAA